MAELQTDNSQSATESDSAYDQLIQATTLFMPFAVRGLTTLGVADVLASGPTPVEEIATAVEADTDALYRTLRYVSSNGVFDERPGRVFALNATAEYLRSDAPNSMRQMLVIGERLTTQLQILGEIVHTLRTGESGRHKLSGANPGELAASRQSKEPLQYRKRPGSTERQTQTLIEAIDFTSGRVVVDVGGGTGMMLGSILARNPHLTGVLFDLPPTVEQAPPVLEELGVAQRCRTVGGDILTEVPAGADTYLLCSVLHGFPDDKAVRVLANVRAAMPDNARLVIAELLVNDAEQLNPQAIQQDFMMLVAMGGRKRSADEHAQLLRQAGFQLLNVTTTTPEFSVLEARPLPTEDRAN